MDQNKFSLRAKQDIAHINFRTSTEQKNAKNQQIAMGRAKRKISKKSAYRQDQEFWESLYRLVELKTIDSPNPTYYHRPADSSFYGGTAKDSVLYNYYENTDSMELPTGEEKFFRYFYLESDEYVCCYHGQIIVFSHITHEIHRIYRKADVKRYIVQQPMSSYIYNDASEVDSCDDKSTAYIRTLCNEFYLLWHDFINRHMLLLDSASTCYAEFKRLHSVLRYFNRKNILALQEIDAIASDRVRLLDDNLILCESGDWGRLSYSVVTSQTLRYCRITDRKLLDQLLFLRRKMLIQAAQEESIQQNPPCLSYFFAETSTSNLSRPDIGCRIDFVYTPKTNSYCWHSYERDSHGTNMRDFALPMMKLQYEALNHQEQWFHQLSNFLFDVTSGSPEKLEALGRFLAECVTPIKKAPLHVYAFHGSYQSRLTPFLCTVFGANWLLATDCKKIVKASTTKSLIETKAYSAPLVICDLELSQLKGLSDEHKKRLKKIMTGATITSKDALFGSRKFKNSLRYLVFGKDEAIFHLSHMGVQIQRPSFELPEVEKMKELSPFVFAWIASVLVPWSMMQRRKQSATHLAGISPVGSFLDFGCTIDSDVECVGAELYEYYKVYCEKREYSPLKKKDFNATLMNDYHFNRYRPHYTRKTNPYYFKGIAPKKDGIGEPLVNHRVLIRNINKLEFTSRLKAMEKVVRSLPVESPPPPPDNRCKSFSC